jgi:putative endonuclease
LQQFREKALHINKGLMCEKPYINMVKEKIRSVKDNRSTGNKGEEIAGKFLSDKGMKIVERNYRCGHYEIDLIAVDGDCVVFCEVKTAKTGQFGSSVSWVTPRKIKNLSIAANEYIISHPWPGYSFRFDVVGIEANDEGFDIKHLKNAFDATETEKT